MHLEYLCRNFAGTAVGSTAGVVAAADVAAEAVVVVVAVSVTAVGAVVAVVIADDAVHIGEESLFADRSWSLDFQVRCAVLASGSCSIAAPSTTTSPKALPLQGSSTQTPTRRGTG